MILSRLRHESRLRDAERTNSTGSRRRTWEINVFNSAELLGIIG